MTDVMPGAGRLAHAPSDHPKVKAAKVGILLANLGTPDNYDYWSMRRYLNEFLSDKRVVDIADWKWQPLLQLIILTIVIAGYFIFLFKASDKEYRDVIDEKFNSKGKKG